jgi:hypothetical protein
MDEHALAVSFYCGVLEAAKVASDHPPEGVVEFNDGDFEWVVQDTGRAPTRPRHGLRKGLRTRESTIRG